MYVIKHSDITRLSPSAPEITNQLAKRSYKLGSDQDGLYLQDFGNFILPERLHEEEVNEFTNMVLESFSKSQGNLGVLLTGLKGTGKSVQAKHIAIKSGLPIIILDRAFHGSSIQTLLDILPGSCLILIDEFEKTYRDVELQESLLPVFDGTCNKKHLFLLAANDEVSQFLIGRPSRIRYKKHYDRLSIETIDLLVNDRSKYPEKNHDLSNLLSIIPDIGIDTVVSLVEETNRYPRKTLQEIMITFNLDNPINGQFTLEFPAYFMIWKTLNEDRDMSEQIREKFNEEIELFIEDNPYLAIHQCVSQECSDQYEAFIDEIANKYKVVTKFKGFWCIKSQNLEGFIHSFINKTVSTHLDSDKNYSIRDRIIYTGNNYLQVSELDFNPSEFSLKNSGRDKLTAYLGSKELFVARKEYVLKYGTSYDY